MTPAVGRQPAIAFKFEPRLPFEGAVSTFRHPGSTDGMKGGLQVSRRGEVVVLHRSNAYLHTRIVGHFDMDLANVLIGTLEDWMGSQRGVVAFHDCVKLENYDVEARERITTWSRTRVDRFDGVHLLVEGRIIGWALRLVSVAIGGKLTTHYDRAAFEGVIARRRNVARPDR